MIAWREEGIGSVASIGEQDVGLTWPFNGKWIWEMFMIRGGLSGEAPTLSAAKAALAEAVGEWCARANLVHLPAGHVMVPREPTKAMVVASFCALRNHINSLPESDKLKYNGRKGGKRVDEYLKVTLRYTAMLSAHPSREELT